MFSNFELVFRAMLQGRMIECPGAVRQWNDDIRGVPVSIHKSEHGFVITLNTGVSTFLAATRVPDDLTVSIGRLSDVDH